MNQDKIISTLNNLIETAKDGEQGFRTAAEGVQNTQLKSRFTEFSRERAEIVRELQDAVVRLGGQPEQAGSVSGSLHRGWMNIRTVVSSNDEGAIVSEAERGEDVAKRVFEEALREELPTEVRSVVERAYEKVKAAHDRVREIEQTGVRR
jgi:uncharacterized protein (TIGR02284 family)